MICNYYNEICQYLFLSTPSMDRNIDVYYPLNTDVLGTEQCLMIQGISVQDSKNKYSYASKIPVLSCYNK